MSIFAVSSFLSKVTDLQIKNHFSAAFMASCCM